jgi:ribosomal protein S18 acetylase RimI-like enzyme
VLTLFDNIAWHSLTGPHARFADGTGNARRYGRGFSPIAGFADAARPDFDALAPHCAPDEHFYCGGWAGPEPAGWRIDFDGTMFQMVWDAPLPEDEAPDARPLAAADVEQAVALATLTRPGPFGPRTIELGEYFGIFEGERLVAMAGERFHAFPLREVSGVCTQPDRQGNGFARRLMTKLIHREMQRGETPVLHVMSVNRTAHALYLRMGFRDYREIAVRVFSRR